MLPALSAGRASRPGSAELAAAMLPALSAGRASRPGFIVLR
jgi:hypothetical protein